MARRGKISTASSRAAASANQQVTVGVMGLSRGRSLAVSFAKRPGVRVKFVCDVDLQRAATCAKLVQGTSAPTPEAVQDFRRILDDKEVDALICAAPNHWHAPATILGCAAGKHVYVEKPCSHNPHEGELMIQASRKHRRAVQLGTQRRSGPTTTKSGSRAGCPKGTPTDGTSTSPIQDDPSPVDDVSARIDVKEVESASML